MKIRLTLTLRDPKAVPLISYEHDFSGPNAAKRAMAAAETYVDSYVVDEGMELVHLSIYSIK